MNPSVIVYKLNMNIKFKPILKKKRTFNEEKYKAIDVEV